jgi:hypothetical protein
MAAGAALALIGSVAVHFIGLPKINSFNEEIYSWIPRGWQVTLVAQIVALTGVLVAMAGMALAFLYKRELTWARATIGAFLFTALMMILFGVVPNEFLTLTQSTLDWSGLKLAVPACSLTDSWLCLPEFLTLGNPVSISYAALKDMIGQGYILTVTAATVIAMWKWQERQKTLAEQTPAPAVSKYGRPITKVER